MMDGAGGGYIAMRINPQTNKDNLVCGLDAPALRRRIARIEGLTPVQLATRQARKRAHLKAVS
ncbi:hypothetical protein [Nonomuraea roseola]|uniref:DUF3263 domain-containing protein n=1 Tax=Nonomuraea roseola TaxID=46179 RepID=A0ABV5Q0M9_9ACTN